MDRVHALVGCNNHIDPHTASVSTLKIAIPQLMATSGETKEGIQEFIAWTFHIKSYLMTESLWDLVDGATSAPTPPDAHAKPKTLAKLEATYRTFDADGNRVISDEQLQRMEELQVRQQRWDHYGKELESFTKRDLLAKNIIMTSIRSNSTVTLTLMHTQASMVNTSTSCQFYNAIRGYFLESS